MQIYAHMICMVIPRGGEEKNETNRRRGRGQRGVVVPASDWEPGVPGSSPSCAKKKGSPQWQKKGGPGTTKWRTGQDFWEGALKWRTVHKKGGQYTTKVYNTHSYIQEVNILAISQAASPSGLPTYSALRGLRGKFVASCVHHIFAADGLFSTGYHGGFVWAPSQISVRKGTAQRKPIDKYFDPNYIFSLRETSQTESSSFSLFTDAAQVFANGSLQQNQLGFVLFCLFCLAKEKTLSKQLMRADNLLQDAGTKTLHYEGKLTLQPRIFLATEKHHHLLARKPKVSCFSKRDYDSKDGPGFVH
ncbi:uncharacterized protein LOC121936471 isoform X1 [Sceloporus undulatus]|uniref:uncharacterized protein LOC121936471 isoform X1 n=1 Tax=Sceloporus undulatus TaxID=8520 RepID=UPI001C4D18EC|nr:uncharacterized protein LOC121936471 isoform X1 [Sceloporus undulatus]